MTLTTADGPLGWITYIVCFVRFDAKVPKDLFAFLHSDKVIYVEHYLLPVSVP